MPKRTPDQLRYSSETNKIIGQKLRDYYQACTTEELPPRLLARVKKLDQENPGGLMDGAASRSCASPFAARTRSAHDGTRRIAANIAKLPEHLRK